MQPHTRHSSAVYRKDSRLLYWKYNSHRERMAAALGISLMIVCVFNYFIISPYCALCVCEKSERFMDIIFHFPLTKKHYTSSKFSQFSAHRLVWKMKGFTYNSPLAEKGEGNDCFALGQKKLAARNLYRHVNNLFISPARTHRKA